VYADDAHTTPAHGRTYKNTHTVREPIAYDSDEPTRSLTSPALSVETVDAHTTVGRRRIVRGV
jgi:hypothetical protein